MLSATFGFVVSEALLADYRAVLLRPKLRKLHGLKEPEVDTVRSGSPLGGRGRRCASPAQVAWPQERAHGGADTHAGHIPNAEKRIGGFGAVQAVDGGGQGAGQKTSVRAAQN